MKINKSKSQGFLLSRSLAEKLSFSCPCQGVCLVLSITSKAALLQTLAKKQSTVVFSLGQLTVPDRKEIVEKGLDAFGKKLNASAFNNQVHMGYIVIGVAKNAQNY